MTAVDSTPGTRQEWEDDAAERSDFSIVTDASIRRARRLGEEILRARGRAHAKHGDDSIEGIPADDPRWLSILVEEVGEVAHALTYDSIVSSDETERLRLRGELLEGELVDVLAVASAWLDARRLGRGMARADAEAANDSRPAS